MHSFLRTSNRAAGAVCCARAGGDRAGRLGGRPAKPKPGAAKAASGCSPARWAPLTINRVRAAVFSSRPDLRRLAGLVHHRRRLLAQGHRRPVRLQLRPPARRHHRPGDGRRLGGRHHRRLLLRPEGHHTARARGRADLQHQRPGRRRLHRRYAVDRSDGPGGPGAPGDATTDLFDPLLRGRIAASQGDVWWLSLGRRPVAQLGPAPSARRAGRAARHGLELPDRQRGHPLLRLHVLQRHRLGSRGVRRRRDPARHAWTS